MTYFDPRDLDDIFDKYFYDGELSFDPDNHTLSYKNKVLVDGFEIYHDAFNEDVWDEFEGSGEGQHKWYAKAYDSSGRKYTVEWDYKEPDWYSELTEDERKEVLNNRNDFKDFADWEHPIRIWRND